MPDPKPARGEVLIAVKAAALRRLRELFANVNKGLCPDVSLPRRVDLIVPIQLLGKLRIFIQQHLQLGPQTQKFHDPLVHALRHRHARTVWATTTRNSDVHAAVEKRIQQAWKDYFLASLAKLCNSEDLLNEQKPSE
jgi:hypothetical protein